MEIVNIVAEMCTKLNLEPTKAAARVQLSEEYVTFMQYRMPEAFEQTISIAGAVFALYFFDWRIALLCLCVAFPMAIIANIYTAKVVPMQTDLHDTFENVYSDLASRDKNRIRNTFLKIANINTRTAKWGALNFGLIRLLLLFIFLFVLYIAIDLDDFTTGNIYSIVAYLWTFVSSIEYVPQLLESNASLIDLNNRINAGE